VVARRLGAPQRDHLHRGPLHREEVRPPEEARRQQARQAVVEVAAPLGRHRALEAVAPRPSVAVAEAVPMVPQHKRTAVPAQ
jgi:hypothetical protein